MKQVKYKATDYNWIIRRDSEENPNTGKHDVILKVLEFDIEYDFKSAAEAEKEVEDIIKGLIETRTKKQKLPLPVPIQFSKEFTGRLTVRLSVETHRKIYMEAIQTNQSINHLIEKKLAS